MKTFYLILIFCCSSIYAQKEVSNSTIINDRIMVLQDSIKVLNENFSIAKAETTKFITDSVIDKLKIIEKEIVTDKDLKKSLDVSEKTLLKQNYLIDGFGTLYTVITALVGIGSILIYFFSIRPLINQANKAVEKSDNAAERLNNRLDTFNSGVQENIDKNFDEFKKELYKERLDQIFINLYNDLPNQKALALESLSQLNTKEIEINDVFKLFEILDLSTTNENDKTTIVEILIEKNSAEVKKMLKLWANVHHNNYPLKLTLFKYYTKNGFSDYLNPATSLILSSKAPSKEFETMISSWTILGVEFIIKLINYPSFINVLAYDSQKYIYDYLERNSTDMKIEKELTLSLLFKKINDDNETTS